MLGAEPVPTSYESIARLLVSRGRLSGDAQMLAPTVAAAIRADIAKGGRRSRFRHVGGGVVLSQWYVPREVVHRERDIGRAIERYVYEVRRAFLRKVQELPPSGAAELCATWLNAESVTAIRGVRRPQSSGGEMHFAGVRRRGPEEVRLAVVFLRDGREVTRERVIEMRGSAHHYGPAAEIWIVSTGQIASGAREEASTAGALPVALFDGLSLAEAMERSSIGLAPVQITVPALDLDLLDMLRGSSEPPARDRIEPPRERGPEGQAPQDGGGEGAPQEPTRAEGAPAAEGGAAGEEGEAGRRKRRRRRRGRGRGPDEAGGTEASGETSAEGEGGDDENDGDAEPAEPAPSAEPTRVPSDSEEDGGGAPSGESDDDDDDE